MSDLPAATANTMLDAAFVTATVYYMSLHTGDPGTTGASEVTNSGGSSYGRQAITFSAASAGSKVSGGTDAAQSFTTMPNVAVSFFGVWSAITTGTFEGGGSASVNAGAAVPANSTISFSAGGVTLSIS